MVGRLAAKEINDKRPFKPQIYKSKSSYPQGQNRSYNQRDYQNRSRLGNRSDCRTRGQYGNNRTRCYNYREYDHFARDCPTSREERDSKQLQQMLNLKAEEQTHLLTNRQSNPIENYKTNPLNL